MTPESIALAIDRLAQAAKPPSRQAAKYCDLWLLCPGDAVEDSDLDLLVLEFEFLRLTGYPLLHGAWLGAHYHSLVQEKRGFNVAPVGRKMSPVLP